MGKRESTFLKPRIKTTKTKANVKQYVIDDAGVKWQEVEFPTIVPEFEPAYQDALDYYLKGNPYLHDYASSKFVIKSFEEYYCLHKGEYIQINDLLRSGQYTKRQKRKILKSNFKRWKREYALEKHQSIKKVESTFTMIGDLDFEIVGLFKRILLGFGFILMGSLIYNQNNIYQRIFKPYRGDLISESINMFLYNNSWANHLINLSFYLLVISIFFFLLFDRIKKDYTRKYNNANKILSNSKSILNKDFNRKTRKVEKYYLNKVIHNPDKYPPLMMSKVGRNVITINEFEQISSQIILQGADIKKTFWVYNFGKYFFIVFISLGTFLMMSLIIYVIIKGIFF